MILAGGAALILLLFIIFTYDKPETPPVTNQPWTTSTVKQEGGQTAAPASRAIRLETERYDNGYFSVNKPKGWSIALGGKGSSLSYSMQDPTNPLRQIVYYGEVGPVYLSERQRQIDRQYVNMGGTPHFWLDVPVIYPLTPDNFLKNIYPILHAQFMLQRLPSTPAWQSIQITDASPLPALIQATDAKCMLFRVLFKQNNQIGEGLFLPSCPSFPKTAAPAAASATAWASRPSPLPRRNSPSWWAA